jgi:hypothetical protein
VVVCVRGYCTPSTAPPFFFYRDCHKLPLFVIKIIFDMPHRASP